MRIASPRLIIGLRGSETTLAPGVTTERAVAALGQCMFRDIWEGLRPIGPVCVNGGRVLMR